MENFYFDIQRFEDIVLTEGGDTYINDTNGVRILALGGDDSIYNSYASVTIDGGADDDLIYNDSSKVTINGGEGDDYITNSGEKVNIAGGAGVNTIDNYSSRVTIDGGSDNDYISNYGGSYVIINAGDGDNTIYNEGDNSTIAVGAGNDSIDSYGSKVTINGGDGADTISNSGDDSTIDGGQGDDFIRNEGGAKVTLNGGAGNDSIANIDGSNVLIINGEGNDYVYNGGNNSTINGGDGDDYIYNDGGAKVTINGGDGDDEIYNEGSNSTIDGGAGNDTIANINGSNVLIISGEGDDQIYNGGNNSTINGGDGADTMSNSGNDSTIDGGDGDDYIYNEGSNVLITGGEGDDLIGNDGGENVTINGGAGNDSIDNAGDNSTIDGGAGDDYIYNDGGDNVTFVYNSGDDTIEGFNATSTLQVIGGTYSSQVSGVDVIITVGDGSILLRGAATLDTLNIESESEPVWKIKGTTATYTTAQGKTLATVTGLKKNLTANDLSAGISVNGDVITLSAALLSTSKVAVKEKGYTLALGDDVAEPKESEPTWKVSGTKATLSDGMSEGYTLSKDARSITYSAAKSGKAIATISGLKKGATEEDLDFDGETITLSADALGTSKVTLKGTGYALALGDDVKISEQAEAPEWNVSGTKATLNNKTTAGYALSDDEKSITYNANEKTAAVVTLTGLAKNLTAKDVNAAVTVEDNVITLSADILGTTKVAVKEKGYTLALGDDVDEPEPVENTWIISGTKATLSDGTSAGYTLSKDARSITYTAAKATGKAKATISGLKKSMAADDIELYGEKIIIYNDALGTSKVTLKGDYVFAMGYDVDPVEYKDYDWSLNTKKQTATLKANMKAGYVLSDDKKTITYSKAKTGVTIATITGVTDKSGLNFNGETITMTADALGNKVSINGAGYEFAVDGDYSGTITGTKTADIITVNGVGATVNAGKGDDQLTTAGGNTFVYASGDGDDVIADFTEKDRIQITKGTPNVTADDTDVKVTVGKGSITLSDAAGQTISILDKKGNETTYETTAAADSDSYWFIDDDFTTTPQLTELTAEVNSMLGEMDIATDPTQLVQTTPIVTTSTKK